MMLNELKNNAVLESNSLAALCLSPNPENYDDNSSWISDVAQVVEAFILYDSVRIVRFPSYIGNGNLMKKVSQNIALDSLLSAALSEGLLLSSVIDENKTESYMRMASIVSQRDAMGIKDDTKVVVEVPESEDNQENFIRMEPLVSQSDAMGITGSTKVIISGVSEMAQEYSLIQQEIARLTQSAFLPSSSSTLTGDNIKQNIEQRINIAHQVNRVLDSATLADVNMLKELGVPFEFYIPPFLALALEKVSKGSDFGVAVLEIRKQFKPMRKLISEYESVLKDTSQPLKLLLKARTKIFSDIEAITKTLGQGTKVGVWEWADVLDTIPEAVDVASNVVVPQASLVRKLTEFPISRLRELLLKRRYAALFHTYRYFHKIPNYDNLIQSAFRQFDKQWKKDNGDLEAIFTF